MINKFAPKGAAMFLCAFLSCPIVAVAEAEAEGEVGDVNAGQVVQDDEDYLESTGGMAEEPAVMDAATKEPSSVMPLFRSCGVVKKGEHIVATWGECASP